MKVDEIRETLRKLARARDIDRPKERIQSGFFVFAARLLKSLDRPRMQPTLWLEKYLKECEERDSLLCATCSSLRSAIRDCVVREKDAKKEAVAKKKRDLQHQLDHHRYTDFFGFTCSSRATDCNLEKFPS